MLAAGENTTSTNDANGSKTDGLTGQSDINPLHEFVVSGSVAATDKDGMGKSDSLTYSLVNEGGVQHGDSTIYVTLTYSEGAKEWTPHYSTTDATSSADYLGKLVMGTDGHYTFTLANDGHGNATGAANALGEGESIPLTFTPAVNDGAAYNAGAAPAIAITVHGTNDVPQVNNATTQTNLAFTEGTTSASETKSGIFAVSDADVTDKITFGLLHQDGTTVSWGENGAEAVLYLIKGPNGPEVTNIPPVVGGSSATLNNYYGKISISADAADNRSSHYSLEVYNNSSAINELNQGQKLPLTFTVVAGDQHGAYATQTIDTTITGTNDAPSFNGVYSKVYLRDDGVHDGNNPTHPEAGTKFDGYVFPSDHRINVSNTLSTDVTDADKDATLRYSIDTNPTDGSFLKEGSTLTATSSAGNAVDVKIISVSDTNNGATQVIETNMGTLTLTKATGAYSFALKAGSAEVNSLAQGETITFSLRSVVTDEHNASDHHMLSIGIEGANDKPTLSLTPEHNYSDANHQYEVKETVNTNEDGSGTSPVYALGTAADHDDDHGTKLTFGLALGVKQEDAAGNDKVPDEVPGKVSYTVANGVVTMTGTYGTLSIDASGKFSYTVDNDKDSAANKLAEGAIGSDTFTILVKDEHGAWTAKPVTVQVSGVNDPPYLTGGNSINVTESGVSNGNSLTKGIPVATGHLTVTDPDSTLATDKPYTIDGGTAGADGKITKVTDYGILKLDATTGEYEYTLTNSSDSTQKLAAGATYTDKIAITVTDSKGGELHTTINVTITGTNDRPTLDLGSPGVTVTEDKTLQFTGKFDASNASDASKAVNVTDVDAGDSHKFYLVQNAVGSSYDDDTGSYTNSKGNESYSTPGTFGSITGTYGTLTMKTGGTYTYTLNNTSPVVQGLTASDHVTETFYVMVKDKNGAFDIKPLTVTVNGQDDKVQLATTDVHIAQATERGVKFTAPDTGETGSNATGKLTVVMPADAAAEGGANNIQFGFKIIWGHDSKGNEIVEYARPIAGEHGSTYVIKDCGTLSIDKDGNYSFTLNNDSAKVEALNAGQKESLTSLAGIERIELAVWDSRHADNFCSTQKLEVTINGTNDKPYFTVETAGSSVKFDGNAILSSQTSKESLSEDSAKNSELHGKLTGDDVDAADTPGNLKFSLVEKDVSGGVAGLPQVLEGKYGFLHLSENGSYVYTLTKPSELQSLNPGDISTDEVFTVRVRDALGAYTDKTLVIELTGAKDAPHISASNPVVKEAGYHDAGLDTATGNFSISVTDAQDALLGKSDGSVKYSYSQNSYEGKYGTLTVNEDGSYSYKLSNQNPAIDKLNVGDSAADSFKIAVTATAKDASGKPVTVTQDMTINVGIAGTNDAPVLSGTEVQKGIVWKGVFTDLDGTSKHTYGSVVATGHVSGASDVDDSTSSYMLWNGSSTVAALQTEYGTISMNADGSYSYYLDTYSSKVTKALADAKAGGRPLVDTISYKAVDPHNAHSEQTKTIEITISDLIPGFDVGNLGRYGFDSAHSTIEAAIYEDNGDPTKTPGSATPPEGTLSAHGEVKGTWTLLGIVEWDSNQGFGIKGAGNTQVQSSAGNGEAIAGRYGYIVIDPMTGKYTYTLFNDSSTVQSLNQGDVVTETFTLMQNGHVVQESGKDVAITITIHGTNDNPVITTAQNSTITEDAANDAGRFAAQVTGKLVATDADDGETAGLTWKVVGSGPQHGSVEIGKDANGQWTYTYKVSDGYKNTDLLSGQKDTDKFTVQVSDGHGGVTEKEIVITFEGKNNVPTGTMAAIAIHEDTELAPTSPVSIGTLIAAHDDRDPANLSFTVSNSASSAGGMVAKGEYGTLFLDGKGNYTYSLNNASDKVQALSEGKEVVDTFYVTIKDSEGGVSAPVKVDVNITGTNDAPLLSLEKVLLLRDGHTETDSGMASVVDKDDDKLTYKVAFGDEERSFVKEMTEKSVSIEGKYGTLTLNSEGKYTYNLTSHALGVGEKADEKFTITVADEHGGTVSKDLTVSIVGANDAPVITIQSFNTGTNGSGLAYSDADITDTLSLWVKYNSTEIKVEPLATDATKGTAFINGLGTFTFSRTADTGPWTAYTFAADAALAAAIRDNTYGDAITVAMGVNDGHGTTVYADTVVKIEGTNAAPVPALADAHGYHAWSGVLATDAEHNALIFNSGTIGDHGLHFGSLHVDANGNYSYTFNTDEESLAKLSISDVLTDSFSYTVNDSAINGAPVGGELKFHVNTDNWDGHGGHLLFAQENATTNNYEASGGAGNDILIGGSHDDILYGGAGDDILYGGAGHNQLYGGDGNDTLYAGKDGDHLYGGDGNDHLYGGTGSDFLDGGANTFASDHGGNHLYGGDGNDVLVFHQGDAIDGGGDLDMVVVGDGGTVDALLSGGVNGTSSNVKNVEVLVSGDKAGDITSLTDLASKGLSLSKGEDGNIHVDASTDHNWSVATGSHTDAASNTFTTYTHTDSNGAIDLTVAVETLKNTNG